MDEYAREAVEDGVIQCAHFVLFVEPASHGPIDRQVAPACVDGVHALTYVAEIAAASVRFVTYPFPGC
ncbi:hypothetical protein, partial [Burkholderia stabilis]